MADQNAMQASTGSTPYVLLYGRKMRLPIHEIYRPPSRDSHELNTQLKLSKHSSKRTT